MTVSLLSLAAYWRDVVLAESGGDTALIINLDLDVGDGRWAPSAAAQAWGAVEEARADLADETNLNARLVLEKLFHHASSGRTESSTLASGQRAASSRQQWAPGQSTIEL